MLRSCSEASLTSSHYNHHHHHHHHIFLQFIWYEHGGGFRWEKFGTVPGVDVVKAIKENRDMWTYVLWADANGCFLFAQIIFKKAIFTTDMIPDILKQGTDYLVIEVNETGQQTGATMARAIEKLRKRHTQFHNNDP